MKHIALLLLLAWPIIGVGCKTDRNCCGNPEAGEVYEPDWSEDPEEHLLTVHDFIEQGRFTITLNSRSVDEPVLRAGVYETRDSGKSWDYIGLRDTRYSSDQDLSYWDGKTADKNVLYRTIQGTNRHYERTDNGGKAWIRLSATVINAQKSLKIREHLFDPVDPYTIYCEGCIETDCGVRSPSFGLYVSRDGGHTFSLFNREIRIEAFAVSPKDNRIMYAAITDKKKLIKSLDHGITWTTLEQNDGIWGEYSLVQGSIKHKMENKIFAIWPDPNNASVVYLNTGRGLVKSTDGGIRWCLINWRSRDGYSVSPVSLAIDPANNHVLFAGTFFGLYKSSDQGCNWERINVAQRLK